MIQSDMNPELTNIVNNLQDEQFFYLEDGSLKDKLIANYLDEEDAHAEILEFEHNASLRLRQCEGASTPIFYCRLETSGFHYQVIWGITDFNAEEATELIDLLRPHCPISLSQKSGPGKNIIRKKMGDQLLGIAAAAKALELSHRSIKALIPCSETRIVTEAGNSSIKEYYWDKKLIDRFKNLRLKQQEGRGYNSDDLTYIAESCCAGDRKWARDCISDFLNQRKLSSDKTSLD
jgi:hypothetical protein